MRRLRHCILTLMGLTCAGMLMAQTPYKVEYFLDGDPGYGLAQTITNIQVGGNELTFDLSEAACGAHLLFVRAQDSEGRWSTTMSRPLLIDRFQDIVYVEYFFDNDPGIGNGMAVQLPDQSYKAHLNMDLQLDITGLSLGEHELFVRARDRFDQWTDVQSRRFTIVQGGVTPPDTPQTSGDLSRIEYFFDTDPGYGLANKLENPRTGKNTYLMDFKNVDDGAHILFLRAQDTNGNWSATLSRPFYVYRPFGKVMAVEYFFDADDPGEGKATAVQLPQSLNEAFAFEVALDDLSLGKHQLNVRAKSDDGQWSVIYGEPFLIVDGSDTGVRSVERILPISISATRQTCILTADNGLQSDCTFNVVTLDGMNVAVGIWPADHPSLTIPISVSTGTVLIVTVNDLENHYRVVRRIIAR